MSLFKGLFLKNKLTHAENIAGGGGMPLGLNNDDVDDNPECVLCMSCLIRSFATLVSGCLSLVHIARTHVNFKVH